MTKLLAHYGIRDIAARRPGSPRRSPMRPTPRGSTSRSDVPSCGRRHRRRHGRHALVTKRARFAAERVEFLVENS